MRFQLLIFLFLISALASAQDKADSVAQQAERRVDQADSLFNTKLNSLEHTLTLPENRLDSVSSSFYTSADSLKASFRTRLSSIDSSKNKLQSKIDSLQHLRLPTEKYTAKLDSVNRKREEAVASLNQKMETLKSKTIGRVNNLNLPPELSDKVSSVTKNIDGFKLPVKDLNIPSLNTPDNPLKGLDGFNTSVDTPLGKLGDVDGLKNINGNLGDVTKLTGQAGDLTKGLGNLPKGDIGNINDLSSTVENKAAEAVGLDGITKEAGDLDVLKNAQNPEAMKQELIEQAQQKAVDHFAGKEEALQKAMDQMAKLKQKYSSLNSLSEIPKKRPNEMRGKPFVERLVPGLGLQFISRFDNFMVDFNPYAGYRFNGRLTVGPGWTQRVAYNRKQNGFDAASRVFGPRLYGEFNLGKGFLPRLDMEFVNALVPPKFAPVTATDLGTRQWVFGVFVGLKKEYRIYKSLKGTSTLMFRLINTDHKSPYPEVVNVRIGFELPYKKKVKQNFN